MGHRLGVDVGGTFTDFLLVNEETGTMATAKVPSTPVDPSVGVLNGIALVCERAHIDLQGITYLLHGTTVATNAILTGTGARVGLVVTRGYRQVLQIARSFVPGALSGWVLYNKSEPLAPLECTVEVNERVDSTGRIVEALDEKQARQALRSLKIRSIEALTISCINAYANGVHEEQLEYLAKQELPGVPVSLSSQVLPEMQEYERTITTVANSYVRPSVEKYVKRLRTELSAAGVPPKLHILRSDGGLASASSAERNPVNLLMSGPAGGVAGAVWVAGHAGYKNLLTLDMGGTSTDVALIQDGQPRLRRETTVGDVTVRASSIDVRSVGAGGGSIAHVPPLTKALRVGPQSAGAVPGPACYGNGGPEPTVTDANLVLGVIPDGARLGGAMSLDRPAAEQTINKVANPLGLSTAEAAAGIIQIINETMFHALRLVSVQQGVDPRNHALVAFGGAGPLHANALASLLGTWPVIIPSGPGVLCAYGDVTTRLRHEVSRTVLRPFQELNVRKITNLCDDLAKIAAEGLAAEQVPLPEHEIHFEIDIRYRGQGTLLTLALSHKEAERLDLGAVKEHFNNEHRRLYTYSLKSEQELVNVRAVVQGPASQLAPSHVPEGDGDPRRALSGKQSIFLAGSYLSACVYERSALRARNIIRGPAIVVEMDSTTIILPKHSGHVDQYGNILIWPDP